MAITMTRVNGVYEIDLGITMIFVANNDAVIYLGATNSDPWGNEWNTTTAQTLDSVIGVNNYDIGHNFNTTGGGNAGCIGCVCRAVSQSGTHKGRGYTGRANPTGDAFDIDYVAHEMGHQFGGTIPKVILVVVPEVGKQKLNPEVPQPSWDMPEFALPMYNQIVMPILLM
ncbi:hypothetical protein H9X57_11895 [Flavobacterium piscinae]|uniref:zinc-dependent metalloprotease family protein n=1 Tax=Flavobacterium piscinae TaxID=2506424 RepID=UPI0019A34A0E|nr:zinc-dependent metalloprotease family protein [Flavobacterium piscinae]MBC8883794.1 hypothetical protein [Flavobacterium piscinae]